MKNTTKIRSALLLACLASLVSNPHALGDLEDSHGNVVTSSPNGSDGYTYDNTGQDPTAVSGPFTLRDGGSLTQSSGSLTINNNDSTLIGQQSQAGSTGTVNLSGGNLTVNDINDILGNTATGVFNITGGTYAINASNIFLIGRENGNGFVNLSGGLLTVSTPTFEIDGVASTISLSGTGIFQLTDFSSSNTTINRPLDFASGSDAELSFGSTSGAASQAYFDGLINSSLITIDGQTATASDFRYTTSGNQGILTLATDIASTPEPSTYALLVMGCAALFFVARRRASQIS